MRHKGRKERENVNLVKKYISRPLKSLLKDDEAMFRIQTATKIVGIPFILCWSYVGTIFIVLRIDFIFIKSHELFKVNDYEQIFFDTIISETSDLMPYVALFFIGLFFFGLYFSNTMLRPFRVIGRYCEEMTKSGAIEYNPDFITDLKVLTTFCEWFFHTVNNLLKNGRSYPIEVPPKYKGIRGPVFENLFFFRNAVYFTIIMLASGLGVHVLGVRLSEAFVDFAQQMVVMSPASRHFLLNQSEIFWLVTKTMIVLQTILYIFLNIHLYSLVNVPAFGIFATLRSFIKGNYSIRVHLLGHRYVRTQSIKINKYLKLIESKFTSEKN